MEGRRMEKLTTPSHFLNAGAALLTPSHFTPGPLPPSTTGVTAVPAHTPHSTEGQQLRPENHALLLQLRDSHHTHRTQHTHGPDPPCRCGVREETREVLRGEVERLKEELREQERKISRQRAEQDELCAELSGCKTELDNGRQKVAELQRECVWQREQRERELQDCREETHKLQKDAQEQLQQVCEQHSSELSSLSQVSAELQNTLHSTTQEVNTLQLQLQEVTSERDALKKTLSVMKSEFAEQTETLQKLRGYIGKQTGEEDTHTLIQRLQKEKESLCVSVELLNIRVKSANDILNLQEQELVHQCNSVQVDSKAGRLLCMWREKVFTLLVQLRSRDAQLQTENTQLHNTMCELQQEVQRLQSQLTVQQHNLQDKTAQLELQNIHTQELQQRLCSVVEELERVKEQRECSGQSLRNVSDAAHRLGVFVEQWADQMDVAQSRMNRLAQRLTFANTRLDTVHGLVLRREALRKAQQAAKPTEPTASTSRVERLQEEVELLSSERDRLAQELKRTPQLIHNALSDLQHQLEREVGLLTQALSQSGAELDVCESQRLEAQTRCEEQERTIAELRTEAQRTQQHWQQVVQDRILEIETSCSKQLREMETQLNTARREHTKAVVALRQVERTAERQRVQERDVARARTEHTTKQLTQLHTQLKHKDRERNILLAVVEQQGLMSEYRRMRRAALHTSKALHEHQHKQEGSVLSVLGEVRSLSSAAVHSTDEDDEEEEEEHGTTHT